LGYTLTYDNTDEILKTGVDDGMMMGNSEENSNFRRAGYCFILTGKINGT
jgi:hypothetical protein